MNIGVLGAGHLGSIHLDILKNLKSFNLIGFYDPDQGKAEEVSKKLRIRLFSSVDELIEESDVVDIVSPTLSHYHAACQALKRSRHVFIEKPVTNTLEEAKNLIDLAQEANVKVQVGHVERFNPAFGAARKYLNNPMFIEAHRLAKFNPRGTDVSVIHDLMIHDIDLVLSMVNSTVQKVSASGVAIVSDIPDIANARIEFDNGCVANLTASRISLKDMRKVRIFQKDSYLTIDLLQKKLNAFRISNKPKDDNVGISLNISTQNDEKKFIHMDSPSIENFNAIEKELVSFANAIAGNYKPEVTLEDGYQALELVQTITEKVNYKSNMLNQS